MRTFRVPERAQLRLRRRGGIRDAMGSGDRGRSGPQPLHLHPRGRACRVRARAASHPLLFRRPPLSGRDVLADVAYMFDPLWWGRNVLALELLYGDGGKHCPPDLDELWQIGPLWWAQSLVCSPHSVPKQEYKRASFVDSRPVDHVEAALEGGQRLGLQALGITREPRFRIYLGRSHTFLLPPDHQAVDGTCSRRRTGILGKWSESLGRGECSLGSCDFRLNC